MEIEYRLSEDGSGTLYLPGLDESYHSMHGALRESRHVYLQHGLELLTAPEIRILEFGFGTGLNALLSWQFAREKNKVIRYFTAELQPLPEAIWAQLNYGELTRDQKSFEAIHRAGWNQLHWLSEEFGLFKFQGDFRMIPLEAGTADIVFYDAFAPAKQPAVWEMDFLEKAVSSLKSGGILVTYCAQGRFRRDLKSLGFETESLPGPPGKKEMTRARLIR